MMDLMVGIEFIMSFILLVVPALILSALSSFDQRLFLLYLGGFMMIASLFEAIPSWGATVSVFLIALSVYMLLIRRNTSEGG